MKRVIPPKEKCRRRGSARSSATGSISSAEKGNASNAGMTSGNLFRGSASDGGAGSFSIQTGSQTLARNRFLDTILPSKMFTTSYKKLKKEFIVEMRHLSKLR